MKHARIDEPAKITGKKRVPEDAAKADDDWIHPAIAHDADRDGRVRHTRGRAETAQSLTAARSSLAKSETQDWLIACDNALGLKQEEQSSSPPSARA